LGGRLHERVAGHDIFKGLHERLNQQSGFKVFFLGSSERTLALIRERIKRDYPNINVVGTYSPPFKPEFSGEENDAMIQAINQAKPDVLWVGMTAPKQEKWIFKNKARLNVKFVGAIGAVFDFYAGTVNRAPVIFQKLGMEWFYRLIREPRRMWRRYIVNNFKYIWYLLMEKISV
jgi:N-acetylglucosaminyldiphosphoundecaprenol N-acetyl-beta-D-mannosaminyltransferase